MVKDKSRKSNLGVDILLTYSKPADLLQYLKELHTELSVLDQDVRNAPKGLYDTAISLLSPKILQNPNKEVRVLICCCLVDVLRIYAPDAPFPEPDMLKVFDLINSQIRVLQNFDQSTYLGEKIYYILNSLASVKSCVLPILMGQNRVPGAEDTVQSMFHSIISSIRPEHSQEILNVQAEILKCCIEEFDVPPIYVLDTLLSPLLPSAKLENPTAYKLVVFVLRAVSPLLESTLARVVEHILVGSNNDVSELTPELSEEIYSLIFELHKISPGLLNGIIPSLTMQLRVEDEDIRLKATSLLGKLYSSDSYDYMKDFQKDFKEFLNRLNDLSSAIRLEMMKICTNLVSTKSELYKLVEDSLLKKLRDPAEEIRHYTVEKLIDFADGNMPLLSKETLQEIGERVKDKRFDVRKVALCGLGKIYYNHISSKLLPLTNEIESIKIASKNCDEEVLSKLKFIPSLILKSWGFPEFVSKVAIISSLQELILPGRFQSRDTDETVNGQRASALLLMYSLIDENDLIIFKTILAFKAKVRDELSKFVNAKYLQTKNNPNLTTSTPIDLESALKSSLVNLAQYVPVLDKKLSVLDKLTATKDKVILKLLEQCLSNEDSIVQGLNHKDEIQKRLDSKSALSDFVGNVYDCAANFICNRGTFGVMISALLNQQYSKESLIIAEVANIVLKYSSKLCIGHSALFLQWFEFVLQNKTDKANIRRTKVILFNNFIESISSCGKYFDNSRESEKFLKHVMDYLLKLDDDDDVAQYEKFGKILSQIVFFSLQSQKAFILEVLSTLASIDELDVSTSRVLHVLCFFAALFQVPCCAYENMEQLNAARRNFLNETQLLRKRLIIFLNKKVFHTADELPADVVLAGIKLYGNIVHLSEESESITAPLTTDEIDFESFVKILMSSLLSRGSVIAGQSYSVTSEVTTVYNIVAVCSIQLTKIRRFTSIVSIDDWKLLGWTFLSNNTATRKGVLEAFSSIIHVHPVHIKFLAYPCLLATDSELAETAEKALMFALRRLRRTHEDLAAVSGISDSTNNDISNYVAKNIPEQILAYLLYLASYHPQFPDLMKIEKNYDCQVLKDIVKCIKFLLNCLQQTLQIDASNLPYLFKLVNKIYRDYVDAHERDNIRLRYLAGITLQVLNSQVKSSENLQVYPGDIHLPNTLYKYLPESNLQSIGEEIGRSAEIIGNSIKHKPKSITGCSPSRQQKSRLIANAMVDESIERADKTSRNSKFVNEEVPLRSLPKRSAKSGTKVYQVPDENDSEVDAWNDLIGDNRKSNGGNIGYSIQGTEKKRTKSEDSTERITKKQK